jgi:hypothetical protein
MISPKRKLQVFVSSTCELTTASLLFLLAAMPISAQQKPNVVLILADKVGYGDLGPYC